MKANHNKICPMAFWNYAETKIVKGTIESKSQRPCAVIQICEAETKIVKGTIESKSQQLSSSPSLIVCWNKNCQRNNWKQITTPGHTHSLLHCWNKNCQRNNWKQITTSLPSSARALTLKQKLSKEQLKANHNIVIIKNRKCNAETKIVKGTIESKSQRRYRNCRRRLAETKIVKGTIESKSQPRRRHRESIRCWNKNCQRNNWKQISTGQGQRLCYMTILLAAAAPQCWLITSKVIL